MQTKSLNIEKLIDQAVHKAIHEAMLLDVQRQKNKQPPKNIYKQTEIRLYAYPELRNNIAKYQRDIEDLQHETPGRSKDFVHFVLNGGNTRLTTEEIQQGRILMIERKIYRDQEEIKEIEYALEAVKADEYYLIIPMKYFEGKTDEEIAEKVSCDPSTVRRNKSRLIRRIAVKLYGAEAVS